MEETKTEKMVMPPETVRACSKVAAIERTEAVPRSGVCFPEDLLGDVAKLDIGDVSWRIMALAGNIGGSR